MSTDGADRPDPESVSTEPTDDLVVLDLPDEISAVVLDVGGVLVVPHPEVVREQIADLADLEDLDDDVFVAAHYRGMEALDGAAAADDPWAQYHGAYLATVGVEPSAEALANMRDLWAIGSDNLWCYSLADNVRGLRALAAADVPVAIVSNADGRVELLLRNLAIAQVGEGPGTAVSVIVDSHVLGIAKPDPGIFDPALAALGLAAGSCAYVGDSERFDVAGARAAGLFPVLLAPEARTTSTSVEQVPSLLDVVAALT